MTTQRPARHVLPWRSNGPVVCPSLCLSVSCRDTAVPICPGVSPPSAPELAPTAVPARQVPAADAAANTVRSGWLADVGGQHVTGRRITGLPAATSRHRAGTAWVVGLCLLLATALAVAQQGSQGMTNRRQTAIDFSFRVIVDPDGDGADGAAAPEEPKPPFQPRMLGGRRAYPVLPGQPPSPSADPMLLQSEPGEPFLAIQLSTNEITFAEEADQAGIVQGEPMVHVIATSDSTTWVVDCQATPLVGQDGATIPPARCFVRSSWTRTAADGGAGPGYLPLDAPRTVVARESAADNPVASADLDFRLLTSWEDRPGVYEGQIEFLYIVRP